MVPPFPLLKLSSLNSAFTPQPKHLFSASQMAISLYSISLFTLISLSITQTLLNLHRADAITEPLETSPTVHDLLAQNGFPKGLLPNLVKSYSLSDDGKLEVELELPCYVLFFDLTYYDKKITGKLSYGEISDVSGISVKKLFAWVPITGIKLESDSRGIEFQVGFLYERFPASAFRDIPACRSKPCSGRDGVGGDEFDGSVGALSDEK